MKPGALTGTATVRSTMPEIFVIDETTTAPTAGVELSDTEIVRRVGVALVVEARDVWVSDVDIRVDIRRADVSLRDLQALAEVVGTDRIEVRTASHDRFSSEVVVRRCRT